MSTHATFIDLGNGYYGFSMELFNAKGAPVNARVVYAGQKDALVEIGILSLEETPETTGKMTPIRVQLPGGSPHVFRTHTQDASALAMYSYIADLTALPVARRPKNGSVIILPDS